MDERTDGPDGPNQTTAKCEYGRPAATGNVFGGNLGGTRLALRHGDDPDHRQNDFVPIESDVE